MIFYIGEYHFLPSLPGRQFPIYDTGFTNKSSKKFDQSKIRFYSGFVVIEASILYPNAPIPSPARQLWLPLELRVRGTFVIRCSASIKCDQVS